MNIFTQRCILVVLFALLLEVIETAEAYKPIRPYKYYQHRPWHRPRWYTDYRSKIHHSKKRPIEDYYSHRPGYYRHHSANEDVDEYGQNKLYTIVIQLPKGENKYGYNSYLERKRNYERGLIADYVGEKDYIDEEDDIESKVVNINNKKLQIKMVKGENPQLHIKISRSDDDKNIEIVDKSNITDVDLTLSSTTYENLMSEEESEVNWTSPESSTIYPENHQQ